MRTSVENTVSTVSSVAMVGLNPTQNNTPRLLRVPFGTIAVELRHARPCRCPVRPQTMLTVLTQRPPLLSGNWDKSYWGGSLPTELSAAFEARARRGAKAKLFMLGGNQAVRLPAEFRFEGSEVE